MQTSDERLQESVNEMLQGILEVYEKNLNIPALILLFAGIDFVASLDRMDPNADVKRGDFLAWTNRYLLPGSELRCAAIDLYSARCGWLHTYTSKSRLVRHRDAREIFFQFGLFDDEEQVQKAIKDPSLAVAVHFTRLFNSFRNGLDKWEEAFLNDPDHMARVTNNSEKLLHRIVRKR